VLRGDKKIKIWCVALCVVPQPGKSSLLNVLLGEEDVLPTNGMRACTASVIEVSYAAPPEGHMYVAEVQFMTEQVRGVRV
jgi:predicted GTPase